MVKKYAGKKVPNGVPKNWSPSQIADAIEDFEESLESRRRDLKFHDDYKNGGDPVQRALHAARITKEEQFLKSLKKALKNRKKKE